MHSLVYILTIFTIVAGLTTPGISTANSSAPEHCIPFTTTPQYGLIRKSHRATPSNWTNIIKRANDGDEVVLENGLYPLNQYAVVFEKSITLRSASGNPADVIIEGKGDTVPAEALMLLANNVRIADITVRNVRDHAVAIKAGVSGTFLYNLNLVDITTGHIKGSKLNGNGTIACSKIGYTGAGARGDYNGAIDLHQARGWHIRDNYIYNIWGDGSGCFIDTDCGTYEPGGAPAILLWNGSGENIIERNVIANSFRAITLGLGTDYDGGVVRNNLIINTEAGRQGLHGFIPSDGGISLMTASDVTVEQNTILMNHDYPGQIEVKNGTGNVIRDNVVARPVWDRGSAEFNGCGSATGKACPPTESGNSILHANDYRQLLRETATILQQSGLSAVSELIE